MKSYKRLGAVFVFVLLLSISLNVYFIVNWYKKPRNSVFYNNVQFKCEKLLLSAATKTIPGGRKLYLITTQGNQEYLMTQDFLYPDKEYVMEQLLLSHPHMYFDPSTIHFAGYPEAWEKAWENNASSK